MAGQRQYWVVSPNVDGKGTKVEEWKREIVKHRAAILGWPPDYRKKNNRMGPQFAGDPNEESRVELGDIILIARGKKAADIVGFGVVKGQVRGERLPPRPNKDVYLRDLDPFIQRERAPKGILAVLQHTRAFVPLRSDAKEVRDWMKRSLKLEEREVNEEKTTDDRAKVQVTDITENGLTKSTFGYEFRTKSKVKKARKAEAELQWDYKQWLDKQGRRLSKVKIGSVECDAWEHERRNLIEAKSSSSREDIRMAVGQLFDYAFHGKERFGRQPNMAILVPEYPGENLANWLEWLRIRLIWREGRSFVDNANGLFTS